MTTDYFLTRKASGLTDGFDSPTSPTGTQPRSNPLASKVTSVLSASYTDSDIRDALTLLDKRNIQNNAETRRQLRLDVQKEVLESNGDLLKSDFINHKISFKGGVLADESSRLLKGFFSEKRN